MDVIPATNTDVVDVCRHTFYWTTGVMNVLLLVHHVQQKSTTVIWANLSKHFYAPTVKENQNHQLDEVIVFLIQYWMKFRGVKCVKRVFLIFVIQRWWITVDARFVDPEDILILMDYVLFVRVDTTWRLENANPVFQTKKPMMMKGVMVAKQQMKILIQMSTLYWV